MTVKH